jgi:fatty acid desaturase
MSYTLYGNYHLHHHRIANSYPDVDNFVVSDYTRSPLLGRVFLFWVFTVGYPFYFMFRIFRYIRRLSVWQRVRMNLELAAIFSLVGVAYLFMPLHVFVFFYGLPFLLGAFFASMSQMIEHFEMAESDDDAYSSRTYGTENKLTNFVWNNVMFHNEHHKYPGIPFYNLQRFHRAAYPHYDERVKASVSPYLFRTAFGLWRRILTMDMHAYMARYDDLDMQAERQRLMVVPGIPSEPVVTT